MPQTVNLKKLRQRQASLTALKTYLQNEFIGIDSIIDELINQLQVWYLLPELLSRPVIINLWGMTGVGKTDLIRKLVKFLELQDRFAELELSNSYGYGYHKYASNIYEIISETGLKTDEPNIILVDEIQKFRTIDQDGKEIDDLKFQDFWELLSDGQLAKRERTQNIKELLMEFLIDKSDKSEDSESKLNYWQTSTLAKTFSTMDWMSLDKFVPKNKDTAIDLIQDSFKNQQIYEPYSFRKSLIIICGNLDTAFQVATLTEEAEIDADIFHELTRNVGVVEIKQALTKLFRPEQVSRFGNVHLIYPSLTSQNYRQLIQKNLDRLKIQIQDHFKVSVEFDASVLELVYQNGVFPAQGVRPVLSSIGDIVESNLSRWLLQTIQAKSASLKIEYSFAESEFKIDLEHESFNYSFVGRLDRSRQNQSLDILALTAVHEAAHAVTYASLFQVCPLQIKCNLASQSAHGFVFPHDLQLTQSSIYSQIQVYLAGNVAEEVFFGKSNVTTGHTSDLGKATRLAASYVRQYGFKTEFTAVMEPETNSDSVGYDTGLIETNTYIRTILEEQKLLVKQLIQAHQVLISNLATKLQTFKSVTPVEFQSIAASHGLECSLQNEEYKICPPYAALLQRYTDNLI